MLRPVRTSIAGITLALLCATTVAACGDDGANEGGGATATSAADASTFPRTIEHKYGTTTIDAAPERIVTVGLTDHDAVLALGIVPVGVTEWFGGHPSATWPWAQDELAALGGTPPEVVGEAGTINYERIAALRPDVILALYAGLTEDDYATLAQIAPTVAQPAGYVDYGIPWDELTRTVGSVVGREQQAGALIAEIEDDFAAARAEHPEFTGATAVVASPYEGTVSVYAPQDARGRFMAALGFEQPAEIAELAGDAFSADLSLERLDLIDVDALVWIIGAVETDRHAHRSRTLVRRPRGAPGRPGGVRRERGATRWRDLVRDRPEPAPADRRARSDAGACRRR